MSTLEVEGIDSDGFITCPHCGRENHDAWEYDLSDGSDPIEIKCGWCDRVYTVTLRVTYTYSSFPAASPLSSVVSEEPPQ